MSSLYKQYNFARPEHLLYLYAVVVGGRMCRDRGDDINNCHINRVNEKWEGKWMLLFISV